MRLLPIAAALAALLIPTAPALAAPKIVATADNTPLAGKFTLLGGSLGSLAGGGDTVATGDVNGDGIDDVVFGGTQVVVRNGKTGAVMYMWHPSRANSVSVAVGDLTGDGLAEIITAGGGVVNVYKGTTSVGGGVLLLRSFHPFDPGFTGGIFVAAGDVDGDDLDDIITGAGPGAGPHVKVFDGTTGAELASFFAFDSSFLGGVHVASGDVNRDGDEDIVVGAGSGLGHVKVFDGSDGSLLRSFLAGGPGAKVAASKSSIVVASGATIRVFDAKTLALHASFNPFGGLTVGGVAL